ncbi:PTS system mannose/fructose/sorbose family transporter subunit IID [Ammoniphilus sp. 3BR4]|uniref:PTS system mannose/fructose/sorbose family transporter subunit IID n=1 Tax=Ammoniphilus sp. 3BR4 TaxID=3158265 RepID=UPI003467454F
MSIGTALLLSLLAGFAYFSRRFLGDFYIERPIILAPLAGLIMGDFQTGLIVGGTLEFIFMGVTNVGSSIPPNYAIGGTIGTAFAISSGQGVETALLIAIPASLLGVFCEMSAKTISAFLINAADRMADNGNDKGISLMMHFGNLIHFLSNAIPTFIALVLGDAMVKAIMDGIPIWFKDGLTVAGSLLPALGFALLLSTLASPGLFPLFFIGFLVAAYTNFGVLGIALLAFFVIMVIQSRSQANEDYMVMEDEVAAAHAIGSRDAFSKQDIRRVFFRSFACQSAFSFDRMQAFGFTWALIPILKKIYKDNPEGYKSALKRHLVFFNTHPWLNGPILALTADMELRKAKGEDIEEQAIQGLKSGLMGPIAGVGDSMLHGTLKPLVGGVAATLALQGNPIAPALFFVVTASVHLWVRWFTVKKGFEMGERFLGVLGSGRLRKMMEAATMVGLITVGALTATWLKVKTPLTYKVQEGSIVIQDILDGFMPKILPLAITLLVFWLVRKRLSSTAIMMGLIVAGLILGGLKILG